MWFARFGETNVRTYVRDTAGLSAVLTARATYRLPYYWSDDRGGRRRRRSHPVHLPRRWPGGDRPSSRVTVEAGATYEPGALQPLDHFFTARWRLFSAAGARHRSARAAHPPWPLHRATAVEVDDELVRAAGLPQPAGDPLVHYSPGVTVRISQPERAQREDRGPCAPDPSSSPSLP